MKYVIMADGDMRRWNSENGVPKHLVKVNGNETLLQRLVRQLKKADQQGKIIITSHNSQYDVEGATRYEPINNILEIDRFTWELIENNVCFLYGDTFYTDEAIDIIISQRPKELHFVGTKTSIIAVIVGDSTVMKDSIQAVKNKYLNGEIMECKGWQVYKQYENIPFDQIRLEKSFTLVSDYTQGFNTVEEYKKFIGANKY